MNHLNRLTKYFFLLAFFTAPAFAQQGEWTWMKGSTVNNAGGVFGIQGVADPNNTPPALYEAIEWTDLDGNFWLFGGLQGFGTEINTLWKFDPVNNEWTWMKGSSTCCQAGTYGTMGIPSPSNIPGARAWGSCAWVDNDGLLWLYGGIGSDGVGSYEVLSDLWKYDIATNEWTWVNGPSQLTVPVAYGTINVPSPSNHPGARAESNAAWTDANNNFWMLGGALYFPAAGGGGWSIGGFGNDLWQFDMSTQLWTWKKGTTALSGTGIFGTKGVPSATNRPPGIGSYSKWTDGTNLWMFGGYNLGSCWNTLWRYNITDDMWTWMAGSNAANANAVSGTQCIPDVTNQPDSRYENRTYWKDNNGNFWIFGGIRTSFNNEVLNDLWQYNPSSNEWVWVSGSLLPNQAGSYGVMGVSSPTNVPPGKFGSIGWRDNSGNLWLFGGSDGFLAARNDLWKFVPDPNCPLSPQISFQSSAAEICEKLCVDFFDVSTNSPTSWEWIFPGASPATSTDQNPSNICYFQSGTYDVTLITTSAAGNDTLTLSNYMTVFTNPLAPVITQNGNVITSTPAITYQWQFNSIDIPGATNQSYTISESGVYTVIIADSNSCSAQSSVDAIISGINEADGGGIIAIYPNPSDGNFQLEVSGEELPSDLQVRIYNTIGQLVFYSDKSNQGKQFSMNIELHDIAAGVYFLEISADVTLLKKKLIILD
jgi:PKD repeat protein